MWKWLREKLGIVDCEKGIVCLHKDINEAFNRLDKIESPQQSARRKREQKKSQRHDEIEREQKRRRKNK